MSVARRVRSVSLGVLAALLGAGFAAPPAAAGLVTHCEGTAGAVTVPGELLVPAAKSCVLDGTRVTGAVTVAEGANLVITGGAFEHGVTVREDGYFDATGTAIAGDVTATDGYGIYLAGLATGGGLRAEVRERPEWPTYTYLHDVGVPGDVRVRGGELFARHATFGGSVTGTDPSYVDLEDSVVEGDLTVAGAELGAVFCAGEVYGSASYTGNSGQLQIGADGPVTVCQGASYWGGDLTIADNTAELRVSDNIVRGDLTGTGNDPAPAGFGNRVRGEATGQFADLAQAGPSALRAATRPDPLEQRRADARAGAAAAGPAGL